MDMTSDKLVILGCFNCVVVVSEGLLSRDGCCLRVIQ